MDFVAETAVERGFVESGAILPQARFSGSGGRVCKGMQFPGSIPGKLAPQNEDNYSRNKSKFSPEIPKNSLAKSNFLLAYKFSLVILLTV